MPILACVRVTGRGAISGPEADPSWLVVARPQVGK